MKSFPFIPSADGTPFRRYSGARAAEVTVRQAAGDMVSRFLAAETPYPRRNYRRRRVGGLVWRRRQRGQDTVWFPAPSLTPHIFLCADIRMQQNGGYGAQFRVSGRFWDAVSRGQLAVNPPRMAIARPSGAERQRSAAARFDQAFCLGAPRASLEPSTFRRCGQKVASKEDEGVKRIRGHSVSHPLCHSPGGSIWPFRGGQIPRS